MGWYVSAQKKSFRVMRNGTEFTAYLGKQQIGRAYISQARPGEYILSAIDIYEKFQRKGYGTLLMAEIRKYLESIGATALHSSNEGSGTVQLLDKTFGRDNVQHFNGKGPIDFEQAKKIMDVDFGYTRSTVKLPQQQKAMQ